MLFTFSRFLFFFFGFSPICWVFGSPDRPNNAGGEGDAQGPRRGGGQGKGAGARPRRFGGGHAEKTPTPGPFLRGPKTGLRPEIPTNLQRCSVWVGIRHLGVSAVGPQGPMCPRPVVLQVPKVL